MSMDLPPLPGHYVSFNAFEGDNRYPAVTGVRRVDLSYSEERARQMVCEEIAQRYPGTICKVSDTNVTTCPDFLLEGGPEPSWFPPEYEIGPRTGRGWLVMEGDWGGQIYLTVPVRLLGPNPRVDELLTKLDNTAWPGQPEGASARYNDPTIFGDSPEDGVPGGMGGGELLDRLWLHAEFDHPQWYELATELLGITPTE